MKSFLAVFCLACCGAAFADGAVVTNFWRGGNSAGGGWATDGNWSEGVPTAEQVIAFRNGDVVAMNNDDVATAVAVAGIDLAGNGTTLYLPQSAAAANTYPYVHMEEGTILYVQGVKDTTLKRLSGSGLVTNATSATRTLTIGMAGDTTVLEFSGRLGGRLNPYLNGFIRLTGTESTAYGGTIVVYRNRNTFSGAPVCGVTEVTKFGSEGDTTSSFGSPKMTLSIRYSGWVTYIGPGGETPVRDIYFAYNSNGNHAYPNTLDAGAAGGLRFESRFINSNAYSGNASAGASEVTLTGSNAVPCVVAGEWKDNDDGTSYVFKRGTGTWRFADHHSRSNRNAFAVEEGTLQFDSIAETNVVCSLGLATMLQKPYFGRYNAANNVDYAYLLGGANTNVVFEYTGTDYCRTTTRPIALKGQGAWLRSSSPTNTGGFSLSGVSATADGAAVKTLWLDGANTLSCVGEISDGAGKVGVTKTGDGKWTLLGNQTFSGPLTVEKGVLAVVRKRKYTWFRFRLREAPQIFFLDDVGVFNSAGVRQNQGLTVIEPEDLVIPAGTSYVYHCSPNDYRTLLPGQAMIATSKEIAYFSAASYKLAGLFDGGTANRWRSATNSAKAAPQWDNESSWIPVVFRLPAGADEVSAFDVALSSAANSVMGFSLDGSCDGIVWKNLVNKRESDGDFDHTTIHQWLSDDSTFPTAGGTHIPAESWRFVGREGADGASSLANVSAVVVRPGATLKAEGDEPVTLSTLTLDAANGNGTIDGFDFAADGYVDLAGMPSGPVGCETAITLANLPDGALARLNGWSVKVDGVPRAGLAVVFDGTKAVVRRKGLVICIQ